LSNYPYYRVYYHDFQALSRFVFFAAFPLQLVKIAKVGKAASTALHVQDFLKKHVIVSLPVASRELNLSFPAVNKAIINLQKLCLEREFTGKRHHRPFSYDPYLSVLVEGTEKTS
jgi:hypothetical protein